MKTITENFKVAYDTYYNNLKEYVNGSATILEIGGGAHPSIVDRSNIDYTIVDPDTLELAKAPEDVNTISGSVEEMPIIKHYDLIISKMVLEHVEDPDAFHAKVNQLLSPDGRAIHFFATRHSVPAFFNRFLPESIGDSILRMLKNRNIDESPKYEAYYRKTLGHTKRQISFFENLGYQVEAYHSFVGHKYFKNIPLINVIEKLYSKILLYLKVKRLSTVALVILRKK